MCIVSILHVFESTIACCENGIEDIFSTTVVNEAHVQNPSRLMCLLVHGVVRNENVQL